MKVIISSGYGKLHFHETARAAAAASAHVEFITGWVPQPRSEALLNILGKATGDVSLYGRMRSRAIDSPRVTMLPIAWPEFAGYGFGLLAKAKLVHGTTTANWAFRLAGFASSRYLQDADVFHVRSGAGQGGAIRTARKNGLKVLTDQSIAHPGYMETVLDEENAQAGAPPEHFGDGQLWQTVLKDCAEGDRLLVNSHFVKRTFIEKGYAEDKIDVVYLGVRESFFQVKHSYETGGPIKILFTGLFALRKGARPLLEAVRKVRAGGLDARLQIIGHMGNGRVSVKNSDAEFLTHTPFLPPDELVPALANSDMYVFPTLAEGCARSAMEAAAAGLPVVTTESCGLPFEDGRSVVYVPTNDVEALAEAIVRLAASQSLRESIGRAAAAEVAAKYTWSDYGQGLIHVYKKLLAG